MVTWRTAAVTVTVALAGAGPLGAQEPIGPLATRTVGPPVLTLGVAVGDPAHEFAGVVRARLLEDGGVLVALSRLRELRLFDQDGRLVRTFGRSGSGPGELQSISEVFVRGGRVYAWDGRQGRVAIWTVDGDHVRTLNITSMIGFRQAMLAGIFADGRILVRTLETPVVERSGVVPIRSELFAIDPETDRARSLGWFGWQFRQVVVHGPGTLTGYDVPLAPVASVAAARDRFHFSGGRTGTVLSVPLDGGVDSLTLPLARAPVTARERDHYIETAVARLAPRGREQERNRLARATYPDSMPAVRRILQSADGNLWVEAFPRAGDAYVTWLVVRDGRVAGRVAIPRGIEVLDVAGDRIVTRSTDELGVEQVHVLPLTTASR